MVGGDHLCCGICLGIKISDSSSCTGSVVGIISLRICLCECMFSVSFLFINTVYMARLRVIALSSMAKG